MAIRRYITQTKRVNSREVYVYHTGPLAECLGYVKTLSQSGYKDIYEWVRVVEQVYNKDLDTWADAKVLNYREIN